MYKHIDAYINLASSTFTDSIMARSLSTYRLNCKPDQYLTTETSRILTNVYIYTE